MTEARNNDPHDVGKWSTQRLGPSASRLGSSYQRNRDVIEPALRAVGDLIALTALVYGMAGRRTSFPKGRHDAANPSAPETQILRLASDPSQESVGSVASR
jgi:hypothetical protein